jgi:hypothetical protein
MKTICSVLIVCFLAFISCKKKHDTPDIINKPNPIVFTELRVTAAIRTAANVYMDAGYFPNEEYIKGIAYSQTENFQIENAILVSNSDTITYQLSFILKGCNQGQNIFSKVL